MIRLALLIATAPVFTVLVFVSTIGSIGEILINTRAILVSVTVWESIQILSQFLAPVLSFLLLVMGKALWNLNRRVKALEKGKVKHSRTLYGDEDDPIHSGLTHQLSDLQRSVDDLSEKVDHLSDQIEELDSTE